MRFLPFISGKVFLIVYAIYSFAIIVTTSIYMDKYSREDYMLESINEDEVFILTNKFNIKHIFYFITYKLYAMKVLGRNSVKKRFYPCTRDDVNLRPLEMEVFNLYESKNGFSPKDFKNEMVDEKVFKEFYDSISESLKDRGFFKSKEEIRSIKNKLNITMLLLLIPGIWRCIGEAAYGESIITIVFEIIIITLMSVFSFSEYRSDNLSCKGKASLSSYRKNHGFNRNSADYRNSKINSADYVDFNNDENVSDNILAGASLGYILGMNQINDSSNNNDLN